MRQISYIYNQVILNISSISNFKGATFWHLCNIFFQLVLSLNSNVASANTDKSLSPRKLVVLDTAALESATDYTVGNELSEIKLGVGEGVKVAKAIYPKCHLDVDLNSMVKIETQGDFQQRVLDIKKLNSTEQGKYALVGFSRSSNAKTVAQLLKGTSIIGVSVGAAAPLGELNQNFFSVAYPLASQWDRISMLIRELKCEKVYGYFPLTNSYSSSLRDFFRQSNSGIELKSEDLVLKEKYTAKDCIFLGGNYSDVSKPINQLVQNSSVKKIIGPADWPLSAEEIKSLLSFTKRPVSIYAPSGWPQNGYSLNAKSRKLKALAIKNKLSNPSPILAYSYDASLWTSFALCENKSAKSILQNKSLTSLFVRNYKKVSESGNFVGDFFIHKFESQNK